MDLRIRYLGFELPHPLMPGASPLADDLDTVRRLEDAGAAAIVMRSLFEEQLAIEQAALTQPMDRYEDVWPETFSLVPERGTFSIGPDDYLELLQRIKGAVAVPLIASLNGVTPGGWLRLGRLLEQAGADALELNISDPAADPRETATRVESRAVAMLATLKEQIAIPVAVKLSPFYSALANFARRLDRAGADGLVLFNRFYQPDIDVDERRPYRVLPPSTPADLPLRLRWLSVLSGNVRASLAASGGVHSATDAIKALMSGAHAVQMVWALLDRGPEYLATVRRELARWLEIHGCESIKSLQGVMSLQRCPEPRVFQRLNYVELLQRRSV